MDDRFDISRRSVLGALGTIGVASAGAGLGTSAYFSDQETFENNQLTAGTLDMKVSWAEHYSDWSEDEAEFASMEDGELVVEDREGFMDATLQEQFPDEGTRAEIEDGDVSPCEALADVPDDLEKPVIDLGDVKPGDFGEVTFDFALCDNPGYVWLNGSLLDAAENGLTEPEADDPDEEEGVVELLDEIQVTVWHDDGDNVLEDPETIVTYREFEPNPISSAIAVSGEDRIIERGTLREVLARLSVGNGIPLDADPTTDGRDCFTNSPTIHYVGFAWELPVDHANEVQSDAATFDLGFYTEQCRHNDGVGLATDLTAYYPLDANADDASGNGYDGTVVGDVSFGDGQVGGAASFDGEDDYVAVPGFPDDPVGTGVSISAWIKTQDNGEIGQRIFADDENNTGGYALSLGDPGPGAVRFYSRSKDTVSLDTPTGTIQNGTWHHVVGVYDDEARERRIYVDGTIEATIGDDTGPWGTDSGTASIGGETDSSTETNNRFRGHLDDVRVYARALSGSEVQSLYDST
jgi:predicted ribosomally synthesized peptide with SipW-like signal peptide